MKCHDISISLLGYDMNPNQYQICGHLGARIRPLPCFCVYVDGNYSITVCVSDCPIGSGPLSQRSAIANVQGGLDWIQTIFFF